MLTFETKIHFSNIFFSLHNLLLFFNWLGHLRQNLFKRNILTAQILKKTKKKTCLKGLESVPQLELGVGALGGWSSPFEGPKWEKNLSDCTILEYLLRTFQSDFSFSVWLHLKKIYTFLRRNIGQHIQQIMNMNWILP